MSVKYTIYKHSFIFHNLKMNSPENQIELNKSNNISSIILRNKYNIINNDEEVDSITSLCSQKEIQEWKDKMKEQYGVTEFKDNNRY